jgi:hypothetical protein
MITKTDNENNMVQGNTVRPIIPHDLDSCWKLAKIIVSSELGPKALNTVEKVFVAIQMGANIGLSPMQAIQGIAVVNGKPALYGDTMLAIIKASGLLESIKEEVIGDGQTMVATCVVRRKGEAEPTVGEWSVADATKAGKWGSPGPWTQYPKRMLQMRARSFALRDAFPDLLLGLQHTVEELRDGEIIDVTPMATKAKPDIDVELQLQHWDGDPYNIKASEIVTHVAKMLSKIDGPAAFGQYKTWQARNYGKIRPFVGSGGKYAEDYKKCYPIYKDREDRFGSSQHLEDVHDPVGNTDEVIAA